MVRWVISLALVPSLALAAGEPQTQSSQTRFQRARQTCFALMAEGLPKPSPVAWHLPAVEESLAANLPQITLLPEAASQDALRVQSISSINPENYGLRAFSRSAFQGLVQIFKSEELTDRFIRHWERLGLIRADVKDLNYAKFKLLARNDAVDLMDDFGDPIVQTYLKPMRRRANAREIDPVLQPVSGRQRMHALLSMFADSLNHLDPTKPDSLEVLKMVLIEVNRLQIERQLNGDSLDMTLAALSGFAKFNLMNLKIPDFVAFVSGFVPVAGPILANAITGWNTLQGEESWRNRVVKQQFIEVSSAQVWQKILPKSVELIFTRRDFRDLKTRAYAFIEKYSQTRQPLFTKEFAADLVAAYPELDLLFNTFSEEAMEESPFGKWHPHVQQVIYRAALLVALYKQDHSAFSKLSREEFGNLRRKMFSNLGLLDDERVTVDEIDLLLTFFVTDVLGRAQSPLIDAVDEDFHVSQVVGHYDFERRAAFLLKRYTLLSYSFTRQSNKDQQLILMLLDGVFTLNMEHILRLDASPASFDTLKELDRRQLSFLFYRSLLSFAGSPFGRWQNHSHTLTSQELQRWMSLKNILDRATDDDGESLSLFERYLRWVGGRFNMTAESPRDRVLLRLGSIAGLTSVQLESLKRRFEALAEADRDMLIRYMQKYPVLIYGGFEFFSLFQSAKGEASYSERMDLWLQTLARVYRALDHNPQIRVRVQNTQAEDIRLFVEPVADMIERRGLDALSSGHFYAEKFKFGYVIQVGI